MYFLLKAHINFSNLYSNAGIILFIKLRVCYCILSHEATRVSHGVTKYTNML